MNLDGSGSSVTELPIRTNAQYLAMALNASKEGDGYHVIFGTGLDSEVSTEKKANIVASNGTFLFINLDPKT